MKKLAEIFIRGLLIVAPLTITIMLLLWIVDFIDGPIRELVSDFGKKYLGHELGFQPYGVGILITFLVVFFMGMIGDTLIVKPFLNLLEKVMERTPLVKIIYSGIKDLFEAFISDQKKFSHPVLVEMIRQSGLYKIGYVTKEDMSDMKVQGLVAVYFPHSYNFSGNLYLVSPEQIKPLEVDSTEAMKFVVSGGVMDIDLKKKP